MLMSASKPNMTAFRDSRRGHTMFVVVCGASLLWPSTVVAFVPASMSITTITTTTTTTKSSIKTSSVVDFKHHNSLLVTMNAQKDEYYYEDDSEFYYEDDYYDGDDYEYDQQQQEYSNSRRKYLLQLAGVALVPPLVVPPMVDALCQPQDDEKAINANDNAKNQAVNTVSQVNAVVPATTTNNNNPAPASDDMDKKLEKDEKEIIQDIQKEEKDEIKAKGDTGKLIADLQKQAEQAPPRPQVKEVKTSLPAQKNQLADAQKLIDLETKDLIDQLEAEEEQIEQETLQLMRKVETLEATAERLNKPLLPEPDALTAEEAVKKSEMETNEFLDKLKRRSQEKQDFINVLKQESAAYAAGKGEAEKKLPEFLASLRQTTQADQEFGISLNSFRERLQSRFNAK